MPEGERRQRSEDHGVKLAKALRDHVTATAKEHDLDVARVLKGAGDYLTEDAEFRLNPPIDTSRVE